MHYTKKRQKAFSLIELLVVIAILGILASLLMPSLKKALNMARLTSCCNNKKQIFIGFFNYADENRGYFPPRDSGAPSYHRWYSGKYLGEYLNSPTGYNSNPKNDIFYCTAYENASGVDLGTGYNYFWNNRINRSSSDKRILQFNSFQKPDSLAIVVDTNKSFQWSSYNSEDWATSYRHSGLCAALFASGVTRSVSRVEMDTGIYTHKAGP